MTGLLFAVSGAAVVGDGLVNGQWSPTLVWLSLALYAGLRREYRQSRRRR